MIAPRPTSQTSSETARLRAGSAWRGRREDSVSRPKNTVAVIRAQFFPALLAKAIHSHSPIADQPE